MKCLSAAAIMAFILICRIDVQATAGTLLLDTFLDGNSNDAMPVTWRFTAFDDPRNPPGTILEVIDGDLHMNGVVVVDGLLALENTSIRTQARLLSDVGAANLVFVGVQTRRNDDTNDGYSAALWPTMQNAFIVRETGATFLAGPVLVGQANDITQNDVVLQFDAIGDERRFWWWPASESMPAEPALTVTDAVHSAGVISLFSVSFDGPNPVSIFRYVHVADHSIRDGDATDDGRIDVDDLNAVRNNFGAAGAADGTLAGDAVPFDGLVNIDDLNAVRNNFGAGTNAGAPAQSVPEPGGAVLAMLATALCATVCRRRRLRAESGVWRAAV